jgi:hypothetical protein
VIVGIGPWWGYPYGYGYGGYYYPPPAYAYGPPAVVEEEPPVYAERDPAPDDDYWYFCESLGAYYPRVERCPEEWVRVPPRP